MSLLWYAIASHANKEDALARQLETRDFEIFYPRIRVKAVNPRSRSIRPYFPGYLFVHADINEVGVSIFKYMLNAKGLITFGDEPSVVPDPLIETLRKRLGDASNPQWAVAETYQPGEPVVIQDGPFSGYEAIFDLRLTGTERVRVLLKMLSDRQMPVELHEYQIKKKTNIKK